MTTIQTNNTGVSGQTSQVLAKILNILITREYDIYPGLLTGNCGLILFLARYYRYVDADDMILKRIGYLLDKVFLTANTIPLASSYASGYSGIAWLLFHLCELDIIEHKDFKDPLDQLLGEVRESLETDLKKNEYDVLYGFIGKYFHYKEVEQITNKVQSWLDQNIHRGPLETTFSMRVRSILALLMAFPELGFLFSSIIFLRSMQPAYVNS